MKHIVLAAVTALAISGSAMALSPQAQRTIRDLGFAKGIIEVCGFQPDLNRIMGAALKFSVNEKDNNPINVALLSGVASAYSLKEKYQKFDVDQVCDYMIPLMISTGFAMRK